MQSEQLRVALYVRVSTEDQAREGFSLDAQTKRLKAMCAVRGWTVADVYRDEGYSGRSTDRPEYRRMFAEMDRWDALLVLKMDRIHRNSVNFARMMETLRESGKDFISLNEKFDTTTAMGRFVMDIVERMAQLESEQIGERVKLGMTKKAKATGEPMGSPDPYGYTYRNGELVVIEAEAETVRRIFAMSAEGKSQTAIAEALNEAYIPSKKGGKWSRQAVRNILRNPLYAGYLRWDGIVRPGTQAAIVPRDTFIAVNGPEAL
ncbi:MAG: recombinase family protein [Methanomethylophilus sp.]|jgi:DNA invertase Pin-like site-specific DNA recombinase